MSTSEFPPAGLAMFPAALTKEPGGLTVGGWYTVVVIQEVGAVACRTDECP